MKLKFIIDKNYEKKFVRGEKALKFIDEQHSSSLKYLELTKKMYQKSWNEINDLFSDYIEKITGYKWFYKTYECVVSVTHNGISNWGEAPKIVRGWKENPYTMRRITAHELIISHYFEIYKNHYSDRKLTNGQIWALAEIAAFALTSLTPIVKKFWPWNTRYYTDHNYPQIVKLQNALKKHFLSMNDFDEYINEGIALVKKFPNIGPVC